MKKLILFSAILFVFTLFTNNLSAQTQVNPDKATVKTEQAAPATKGTFTDKNKNGVCDNHESKMKNGKCTNFVDKNGDGVCDKKGENCKKNGNGCGNSGNGCGNGNGFKHRNGCGHAKACGK